MTELNGNDPPIEPPSHPSTSTSLSAKDELSTLRDQVAEMMKKLDTLTSGKSINNEKEDVKPRLVWDPSPRIRKPGPIETIDLVNSSAEPSRANSPVIEQQSNSLNVNLDPENLISSPPHNLNQDFDEEELLANSQPIPENQLLSNEVIQIDLMKEIKSEQIGEGLSICIDCKLPKEIHSRDRCRQCVMLFYKLRDKPKYVPRIKFEPVLEANELTEPSRHNLHGDTCRICKFVIEGEVFKFKEHSYCKYCFNYRGVVAYRKCIVCGTFRSIIGHGRCSPCYTAFNAKIPQKRFSGSLESDFQESPSKHQRQSLPALLSNAVERNQSLNDADPTETECNVCKFKINENSKILHKNKVYCGQCFKDKGKDYRTCVSCGQFKSHRGGGRCNNCYFQFKMEIAQKKLLKNDSFNNLNSLDNSHHQGQDLMSQVSNLFGRENNENCSYCKLKIDDSNRDSNIEGLCSLCFTQKNQCVRICVVCKQLGRHHGYGHCQSCYTRLLSGPKTNKNKNRYTFSNGVYYRSTRQNIDECIKCHNIKPQKGKGMCSKCWNADYYRKRRFNGIRIATNIAPHSNNLFGTLKRTRTCRDCQFVKYIRAENRCHHCYIRYKQLNGITPNVTRQRPLLPKHLSKTPSRIRMCKDCHQIKFLRSQGRCDRCYIKYKQLNPSLPTSQLIHNDDAGESDRMEKCKDCNRLSRIVSKDRCNSCYQKAKQIAEEFAGDLDSDGENEGLDQAGPSGTSRQSESFQIPSDPNHSTSALNNIMSKIKNCQICRHPLHQNNRSTESLNLCQTCFTQNKSTLLQCIDCQQLTRISSKNRCKFCYEQFYSKYGPADFKSPKIYLNECEECMNPITSENSTSTTTTICKPCFEQKNQQICVDCKQVNRHYAKGKCTSCYFIWYNGNRQKDRNSPTKRQRSMSRPLSPGPSNTRARATSVSNYRSNEDYTKKCEGCKIEFLYDSRLEHSTIVCKECRHQKKGCTCERFKKVIKHYGRGRCRPCYDIFRKEKDSKKISSMSPGPSNTRQRTRAVSVLNYQSIDEPLTNCQNCKIEFIVDKNMPHGIIFCKNCKKLEKGCRCEKFMEVTKHHARGRCQICYSAWHREQKEQRVSSISNVKKEMQLGGESERPSTSKTSAPNHFLPINNLPIEDDIITID